jgi:lysozyme
MSCVSRLPLIGGLRLALVAACALVLASCAGDRSAITGDARPHPGVAKARALPIHGIDVSKWQGRIDWASVRDAGYHFMFWCRSAEQQAAWFKRVVPADPGAMPPVLDVEWNGESRVCPGKIPRDQALAMIRTMLHEMERHTGKRPIIYTDITFHQDILEGELPEYPHWVRSTAAEPHARYQDRRWTMWQYTTTGRVPGIKGAVDRNAFYGSEDEWIAFLQNDCDPRYRRYCSAEQSRGTALAQN